MLNDGKVGEDLLVREVKKGDIAVGDRLVPVLGGGGDKEGEDGRGIGIDMGVEDEF